MNNIFKYKLLHHALAWMLFIILEVSTTVIIVGRFKEILWYISYYSLNIALFYFCLYYLFQRAFKSIYKIYLSLFFFTGITLITYVFLSIIINRCIVYIQGNPVSLVLALHDFVLPTYRGIYFMIIAAALWYPPRLFKQRQKEIELEKDRLKSLLRERELEQQLMRSQNAYLQSRLNPHLLFNSLNFIHNVVHESEDASKCIILLSDIVRYSVREPDESGTFPVADELQQIKNIIALNQLRFRYRLHLDTKFAINSSQAQIMPLLLLSLVENIFNHGDLSNKDKPGYVELTCHEKALFFRSRNATRLHAKPGTGLGLSNNRLRLDSHYPGKYSLVTSEKDGYFEVNLRVDLS